jgi:glutaredoxin/glutathione-dependent peroxiredoxin
MTIKVGDKLPEVTLTKATADGPSKTTTSEVFGGKTVALFAVPGAFTPTCSEQHLPGFVAHADELKGKGIDEIACISVNDAFVMGAWGKSQGADGKVTMLGDGNGEFTKALGLELDASGFGMGTRSRRYSMLVEDGVVKQLNLEEGPGLDISSAQSMLRSL